jgi:hypothetical protein
MFAEAFGLPSARASGVVYFSLEGERQTDLEGDRCFRHEKMRVLTWKTE